MTTIEAAGVYLDRNLWPIPVPHRSKGPVLNNWASLRLRKQDLPQYFTGAPCNVGLLVGDDSGTADVDLDCPEA